MKKYIQIQFPQEVENAETGEKEIINLADILNDLTFHQKVRNIHIEHIEYNSVSRVQEVQDSASKIVGPNKGAAKEVQNHRLITGGGVALISYNGQR